MNAATKILADKLYIKARELNTSYSLLLCAFQVFYTNKELLDDKNNRPTLDTFIFYALTRDLITKLTYKAQEKLISPSIADVHAGCRELEIVNDSLLAVHEEYNTFKPVLTLVVGNNPVKRIHLEALTLVKEIVCSLKEDFNAATVSDVVLTCCKKELEDFSDVILMMDTDFTEEQMINVLTYQY
jgi:hypothetical protein